MSPSLERRLREQEAEEARLAKEAADAKSFKPPKKRPTCLVNPMKIFLERIDKRLVRS
jgi:hypothetical protein